MKAFKFLLMAAVAVSAASCAEKADGVEENPQAEEATYVIDKEASTLEWKGQKNENYFHTGKVWFSDGQMTMKGEELISGNFTLDMSTIKAEDPNLDQVKNDTLSAHLQGPYFFNVKNYKDVKVTLGSYKDGKLEVKMNVLGKDLDKTIDADIKLSDDKAWITGKFDVDFKELNMPGMQVQEGQEPIQPLVSYNLKIEMNKQ